MEFRKILIRCNRAKQDPQAPEEVKEYCRLCALVPPKTEWFVNDPYDDLGTLHTSAGFRDAFVRFAVTEETGVAKLKALATAFGFDVAWDQATQHEINETGTAWNKAPGRALMYPLVTGEAATVIAYMSISFEDK